MSPQALRILAYVTVALTSIGIARAGVGVMSGGALISLRHFGPIQTVQSDGCWYANGWNGPGYYPCGNEWNSRPDAAGAVAPIIIPALRRHHRHAVVVAHPHWGNPVYPVAPFARPRARAPVFAGASGQRRFGAAGVHMPNSRPSPPTVAPGFAGRGVHNGFGGGNFHHLHGAAVPHVGGPVSPGLAGAGRFHGAGFGVPHIGAPPSPGFAGGAGLHGLGGAKGVHIAGPASPSFSGVGTFHTGGGAGAHPIGAVASPGLARGGFNGVGAVGAFHGGGAAFGQGGIGHR